MEIMSQIARGTPVSIGFSSVRLKLGRCGRVDDIDISDRTLKEASSRGRRIARIYRLDTFALSSA